VIVSINQPAYLPWLGYFHRIAAADLHVVLDHVQFEKNSFTNRNKIRTREGWTWLTVPLQTKGRFGDLAIDEVLIARDDRWRRKHWDTMRFAYAKARAFADEAEYWEAVYGRPWERLADLQRETTGHVLEALRINTPLRFSSELQVTGAKADLVLGLCRELGATTYLSGPLGRDYLDEDAFARAGIEVRYDDYAHPVYPQAHPGFEPAMAAVDLIFNHGDRAAEIAFSQSAAGTIDRS
jgi:hypothetical protein